ncbi:MAG TPA: class I SAM-dependent methyltransferase [Candidatus Limnocylindrales bacterium]|nr:class I SAM-dependent methyltransferase [Candidatus Limnocylindrales bacterium]
MRSVAVLIILISSLIGSTIVDGQGFRGSPGRGFAGPGLSVSGGGQTRQGPVSGNFSNPPARTFSPTLGVQTQSAPHMTTQRLAPQFVAPVPVFVSPPLNQHRNSGVFIGSIPHHDRHLGFFPRHGGIAIVDVPYFDGTTVITQVAPGVVMEERRYAENPPADSRTRASGQLAPFDPTPQDVVDRMLALAAVKPGDVLYDLGAGDGRIVITAAKKYGVKAIGYEIDPGLVKLARENVRKHGVERLVDIRQQDLLSVNLSPASVVTMYLSYDGNLALRPQLMRQLKAGARVISYTFDMGEWQPKIAESYHDAGGDTHMIYLWQIGEPLAFR